MSPSRRKRQILFLFFYLFVSFFYFNFPFRKILTYISAIHLELLLDISILLA